jgi:hypothetical protein
MESSLSRLIKLGEFTYTKKFMFKFVFVLRYVGSKKWDSGERYDSQDSYEIKLEDVKCTSGEWGSCTYSESPSRYCSHRDDVFLSCAG